MFKLRLFISVLFLAVVFSACAHTQGQIVESQRAIESIHETSNQLTASQTAIDQVVMAINELPSSSNLPQDFKAYNLSVSNVQAAHQRTEVQRLNMETNGQAYISKWQMELNTMQDPGIKSALADRREKVSSSFEHIQSSFNELRDAYQPFLTILLEIQKGLALDLNPSGVEALKNSMDKAKDKAATVKDKLDQVNHELEEMAGSLSPTEEVK